MARTGNGTSARVAFDSTGSNAGLLAVPYSWHCFYRDPNPAGTIASGQEIPVGIAQSGAGGSSSQFSFGFVWRSSSAGNVKSVFHRINGGATVVAQIPAALAANTWYSIAGDWDGSNIHAYLNGQLVATSAAGSMPLTAGVGTVYTVLGDLGGSFARGTMADFYFMNNGNLTLKQIQGLAAGASPVSFYHLGFVDLWWTLLGSSPEPNVFQSRNATAERNGVVTGTTIALHPGVQSTLELP